MRIGLMAWALAACLLVVPLVASADIPAMEDGARIAREAKLRRRAREWLTLKAKIRQTCPRCGGVGKTRKRGGRNPGAQMTCSTCRGGKKVINAPTFTKVFLTYYSPAFRAQPGIKDEIDAKWRSYHPGGNAGGGSIERFAIEDLHMVDETHGIVRLWIDKHKRNLSKPSELRWIWSSEKPGRSGHWYVWSDVDGHWPRHGALRAYGGTRDMGKKILEKLRAEWPAEFLHLPTHIHKKSKDLVVTIEGKEALGFRDLEPELHAEALAIFSRAFALSKRWERVTVVAGMLWRNEYGETDTKPYRVLEFTRHEWGRLKPENLAPDELMRVFDAENMAYPGWTVWK